MKACNLLFTALIISTLLLSCQNSEQRSIKGLLSRHPDLYTQEILKGYKVTRTLEVTYPNKIKISLYNYQGKDDEILVLSEKDGKCYAIPIPAHSDSYWKFYGQKSIDTSDYTFNDEVTSALKLMGVQNSYDAGYLMDDIFTSVLKWRKVKTPDINKDTAQNTELHDSCRNINNTNLIGMAKAAKFYDMRHDDGLYLDEENIRYIQLTSDSAKLRGNLKVKLYTYKIPCALKL